MAGEIKAIGKSYKELKKLAGDIWRLRSWIDGLDGLDGLQPCGLKTKEEDGHQGSMNKVTIDTFPTRYVLRLEPGQTYNSCRMGPSPP